MSTYYDANKRNGFDSASIEAPEYVRDYLDYEAVVANLAPRTVHNYFISIQTFLRWLVMRDNPDLDFEKIDIRKIPFETVEAVKNTDIVEFLVYCSSQRQNGSASRATKLSALKSFFEYNSDVTGRMDKNPAANVVFPKREQALPKYLSEEEAAALISSSAFGETPSRNRCIIVFFLNCGMRLSELTGINLADIRGNALTLRGKERKERVVYLNSMCMDALSDWLADRANYRVEDKQALFVSRRTGKRLTGRAVEKMVDKAFLVSGLAERGYSPHKLRHTMATLSYKSGASGILELQQILGHASTQIVSTYAHIDSSTVRQSMEGFSIKTEDPELLKQQDLLKQQL